MKPVASLHTILKSLACSLLIGMGNSLAAEPEDPRPYGTWDLFEVHGNGMTAQVRLTVGKGHVINSSLCSVKDKRVQVQTASPATITRNEIVILEQSEAQREYKPGFLNCKVSLDKGTFRYQLLGDKLVLHLVDHGQSVELSRSGGLFMQARQLAGMP